MTHMDATAPTDSTIIDAVLPGSSLVPRSVVDKLLAEREVDLAALSSVAGAVSRLGEMAKCAISYMPNARIDPDVDLSIEKLTASLDALYWGKLIQETRLEWVMPRRAWEDLNRQIYDNETPPFTREVVERTMETWAYSAPANLMKKIDDLFASLSREHKTNKPSRFSKRMILSYVCSSGSSIIFIERKHDVHDLRSIVALLLGYEMPDPGDTRSLLSRAGLSPGERVDDTDLPIYYRLYPKAGTLHISISEEAVEKMNKILAKIRERELPEVR